MVNLYYGEDTYTLLRELEAEKQKLLKKKSAPAIEEFEFDSGTDDAQKRVKLQELLEAQDLFAKEKVVIIRNFLSHSDKFPACQDYLLGTVDGKGHGQIFFAQVEKFDKRQKFFKKLQKLAKISSFEIPQGQELKLWIKKQLEIQGFEIETAALELFLQKIAMDYDLWQIRGELEKLMLYGGERKGVIAIETVRKVISENVNYDVFALTNAVAEGRITDAVSVLERMVSDNLSQQKTQVLQVMGALASQIRSLLMVKAFKGTPQDLAKILGWKEGRVWINLKLSSKFSAIKLHQLLSDLRAIDLRLKISDEPAKLLLTLLIQKAKHLA